MNQFEAELSKVTQSSAPMTRINGYDIVFVDPEVMKRNGSFGYHYDAKVYIRVGLPGRVENFVIQHELYHARDRSSRLGWIGRELRANVVCGLKDPIGLAATIIVSLNKERLGAYWRALRRVNFKQS